MEIQGYVASFNLFLSSRSKQEYAKNKLFVVYLSNNFAVILHAIFNGCKYYLSFLNEIQGYVAFFNFFCIFQEQTRTNYKIFIVSLSSCICSNTASNFLIGASGITQF